MSRWPLKLLLDTADLTATRVGTFAGQRPYVSTGDVNEKGVTTTLPVTFDDRPSRADLAAREGNILFARMQATNKVITVTKENADYLWSTGFAALKPRPGTNPRWLAHWLASSWFNARKDALCTGATQKAITNEGIRKLEIPFPPPSEQKRIVKILDEANALRHLCAHVDQRMSQLTTAFFEDMFGNPITNSKRWEVRTLGELTDHLTSGSRDWSQFTGRGQSFFIRTQDVNNGEISEHLLQVEAPNGAEANRTRLTRGDVVVTITGIVGKAAVFRGAPGPVYVSQHLALIRPNCSRLNAEYLAAYANFPLGDVPILARLQYGQTKPGLGFRELTTAKIPVPPLDRQNTFAARIAEIRELGKLQTENRKHLDDLFESLLHHAFQGKL